MTARKYIALDGLRGVAAAAVAIGHLQPTLGIGFRIDNTALAVDFFFILSGFVLSHAYDSRLRQQGSLSGYLLARLIRLYPLIALGMVVGAVAAFVRAGDPEVVARLFARGLLMLPTDHDGPAKLGMFPLDPPAWSLFYELIASVAFGLGLWRGWRIVPLLALAAIALIITVARQGDIDAGWSIATIPLGLARGIFGFTVGILLHRTIGGAGLPSVPFWAIGACLLAVLLVPSASAIFQLSAVFILLPLLVCAGAATSSANVRVCRWLGDLSYPLYILHWPVYMLVAAATDRRSIDQSSYLTMAVAVGCALIASIAALKLYDEPVRRRLSAMVRRDRSGA